MPQNPAAISNNSVDDAAKRGDYATVRTLMDIKRQPGTIAAAELAMTMGDYCSAVQILWPIFNNSKEDGKLQIYVMLVTALTHYGDQKKAKEILEHMLPIVQRHAPENLDEYYYILGTYLYEFGQYDMAAANLMKVIERKADHVPCLIAVANTFRMLSNMAEYRKSAVNKKEIFSEYYVKALAAAKTDEERANVHVHRAMALIKEGESEEARIAARLAVDCDADNYRAHLALGLAHLNVPYTRDAEAIQMIETARSKTDKPHEVADIYLQAGMQLDRALHSAPALEYYKKAREANPYNNAVYAVIDESCRFRKRMVDVDENLTKQMYYLPNYEVYKEKYAHNRQQTTMLHVATWLGSIDKVQMLLERGARIHSHLANWKFHDPEGNWNAEGKYNYSGIKDVFQSKLHVMEPNTIPSSLQINAVSYVQSLHQFLDSIHWEAITYFNMSGHDFSNPELFQKLVAGLSQCRNSPLRITLGGCQGGDNFGKLSCQQLTQIFRALKDKGVTGLTLANNPFTAADHESKDYKDMIHALADIGFFSPLESLSLVNLNLRDDDISLILLRLHNFSKSMQLRIEQNELTDNAVAQIASYVKRKTETISDIDKKYLYLSFAGCHVTPAGFNMLTNMLVDAVKAGKYLREMDLSAMPAHFADDAVVAEFVKQINNVYPNYGVLLELHDNQLSTDSIALLRTLQESKRDLQIDFRNKATPKSERKSVINVQPVENEEKTMDSRVPVNSTANPMDTILLNHVKSGHSDKIKPAIELGADIFALDENGMTALHLSLLNGHTKTAEQLLALESKLFTAVNSKQNTVLEMLAIEGRRDMLAWLLETHAKSETLRSIEIDFEKLHKLANPAAKGLLANVQLFKAVKKNNMDDVVRAWVDGADVNAKSAQGESALYSAVYYGYHDIVAHLLNRFSILPAIVEEARALAVTSKDEKAIRLFNNHALLQAASLINTTEFAINQLLLAGADVGAKDQLGQTPLHRAMACGNKDVAKVLLRKHAVNGDNVRKIVDNKNHTPFDLGERQFADSMLVKFGSYKERARYGSMFKAAKEKQNPAAEQAQQDAGNAPIVLYSSSMGKTSL